MSEFEDKCIMMNNRVLASGFPILEHVIESAQKSEVKTDGYHVINFTSNDYNSFAASKEVR